MRCARRPAGSWSSFRSRYTFSAPRSPASRNCSAISSSDSCVAAYSLRFISLPQRPTRRRARSRVCGSRSRPARAAPPRAHSRPCRAPAPSRSRRARRRARSAGRASTRRGPRRAARSTPQIPAEPTTKSSRSEKTQTKPVSGSGHMPRSSTALSRS